MRAPWLALKPQSRLQASRPPAAVPQAPRLQLPCPRQAPPRQAFQPQQSPQISWPCPAPAEAWGLPCQQAQEQLWQPPRPQLGQAGPCWRGWQGQAPRGCQDSLSAGPAQHVFKRARKHTTPCLPAAMTRSAPQGRLTRRAVGGVTGLVAAAPGCGLAVGVLNGADPAAPDIWAPDVPAPPALCCWPAACMAAPMYCCWYCKLGWDATVRRHALSARCWASLRTTPRLSCPPASGTEAAGSQWRGSQSSQRRRASGRRRPSRPGRQPR